MSNVVMKNLINDVITVMIKSKIAYDAIIILSCFNIDY